MTSFFMSLMFPHLALGIKDSALHKTWRLHDDGDYRGAVYSSDGPV
jgi:hypothetical protein